MTDLRVKSLVSSSRVQGEASEGSATASSTAGISGVLSMTLVGYLAFAVLAFVFSALFRYICGYIYFALVNIINQFSSVYPYVGIDFHTSAFIFLFVSLRYILPPLLCPF